MATRTATASSSTGSGPPAAYPTGWKDSDDAVFHADGTLPAPPIALCEVQGYVYEARLKAAMIAEALGCCEEALQLREAAQRLKARFHEAFWREEIQCYAIALDGSKQPCRIRSSNAGQCLFTDIAKPEAAARIGADLLGEAFFTGWGIRTLASTEARYNPMSCHDGSIWPHDNALIAAGLARYGFHEASIRILSALFDASQFLDLNRLPELYCGFRRRRGEGPTLYPVACNPQAWSSAAVFLLLQAGLGPHIDAAARKIYFNSPRLPESIETLEIRSLKVAAGLVDMVLTRHAQDMAVNVRHRAGGLEVVAVQKG